MLAGLAAAAVTYLAVVPGVGPLPSDHAAVVMPRCAADVWLTIGAGERASVGTCAPPVVVPDGRGARVEGWARLADRNPSASLGALAAALTARGECAGADGPYAALAAAGPDGRVAEYRAASPTCAVQLTESVPAAAGARVITVRLPAHLHLGALTVTDAGAPHLAGSTKRDGLVSIVDVTRLLAPVGIGAEPRPVRGGDPHDLDRLANARQRWNGWWVAGLISCPLLLLIALGLRRRVPPRLALAVAAYGPAGFAVGLVPWWRWGRGGAALAVLAATLALAGLGALAGRRLGGSPELGLAAVVVVALGFDTVSFQNQLRDGLGSYSMLAGGRFYGLGNLSFAILATAVVLLCGAAARRAGPVAWVWGLVPLTALDATAGNDFGGVIALAAALAAGLTRRLRAVAAAAAGGLALALAVAYADSRRDDPSHLGRLFTDGDAWPTIERKAFAALHTVYATAWPLLVVGCGVGAWYLLRGRPELRPTARVLAVLLVAGSLVNDSGLIVAGGGLALATPLLVSYAGRRA